MIYDTSFVSFTYRLGPREGGGELLVLLPIVMLRLQRS